LSGQLEWLVADRNRIAWCDACHVSKNSAQHWSNFELQLFSRAEIPTEPDGACLEFLIIVSRFKMQPITVGREVWIRIIACMLSEVSKSGQRELPFCSASFGIVFQLSTGFRCT